MRLNTPKLILDLIEENKLFYLYLKSCMSKYIFQLLSLCFLFTNCNSSEEIFPLKTNGTEKHYDTSLFPFYHGVASGDPLSDAVIIWTRVTPPNNMPIEVDWQISESPSFNNIISSGSVTTDSTSDFTVKVDVKGLKANTKYFYQFTAMDEQSITGETKTINNTNEGDLKLGVVSCSNYEWGYFAAYKHLSEKELDAILHLGDYFYEYAPGKYGDTTIGRYNIPPREILSLDDYRTRYALYRTDKDLQVAHQKHPFIAIWDDHEITNNAYISGAENHQEDEGSYDDRKAIATQAYYEWLPIRENASDEIYRSFSFGELADLIMLDERLAGRTKQADSIAQVDESYSMLGSKQLAWFKDQLSTDGATWKIIGNQVIFSPLDVSKLRPDSPANLDAWDGYAVERDGIINYLVDNEVDNVVFLTGDTHTSWAFDVPAAVNNYPDSGKSAAVEFGTTSITSANWNEGRSDEETIGAEKIVKSSNDHLKFVNARDHGYLLLTVSKSEVNADWYYVEDIKVKDSPEKLAKTISVKQGMNKLDL